MLLEPLKVTHEGLFPSGAFALRFLDRGSYGLGIVFGLLKEGASGLSSVDGILLVKPSFFLTETGV